MTDELIAKTPRTIHAQVVNLEGRIKVTWPSPHPGHLVLAAPHLRIHDMDTGVDLGDTTLAILCLRAGDGVNGAQGPLIACLLQLSDRDGNPALTPVQQEPGDDGADLPANVACQNGIYAAERWYAIAEMAIGDPLPVPDPTDEVEDLNQWPDDELDDVDLMELRERQDDEAFARGE